MQRWYWLSAFFSSFQGILNFASPWASLGHQPAWRQWLIPHVQATRLATSSPHSPLALGMPRTDYSHAMEVCLLFYGLGSSLHSYGALFAWVPFYLFPRAASQKGGSKGWCGWFLLTNGSQGTLWYSKQMLPMIIKGKSERKLDFTDISQTHKRTF